MTTTIERRVTRLEATTDGGGKCPECGNGADDDKRPYEVVFVDSDNALPDEWCETCGRALSHRTHGLGRLGGVSVLEKASREGPNGGP